MPRHHLDLLFGAKRLEEWVLVWTLGDKFSAWVTDLNAAAKYAESRADDTDVYVGMGLADHDYGIDRRCPAEEISSIPGLWADVDYAGPEHKKQNFPPNEAAALALIDSIWPASLVIHSGHGLQAVWLFKEPWEFESPQERLLAAAISEGWQAALRSEAKKHGWDIDATHDLSRILRLAGTVNHKGHPVPVRLLEERSNRYNPSDFSEFEVVRPGTDGIRPIDAIELSGDATPPFDRFAALSTTNPKFYPTWQRIRNDLQDQSPSGYDMALASLAARAGWPDQDIADLLIAHRRLHGDDLKLNRPKLYHDTIAKARGQQPAQEALGPTGGNPLLEQLSHDFGVPIIRVVKYMSDPPQYRLETARGNIQLGGIEGLSSQLRFRNHVLDAARHQIPRFKGDHWDTIVQTLVNVCAEEEVGPESTDAGAVTSWLDDYLNTRRPSDDIKDAVMRKHPFIKDGAIHIFGTDLRIFLALRGDKVSSKQLGVMLKAAKLEPSWETMRLDDGTRVNRSTWRLSPPSPDHGAWR